MYSQLCAINNFNTEGTHGVMESLGIEQNTKRSRAVVHWVHYENLCTALSVMMGRELVGVIIPGISQLWSQACVGVLGHSCKNDFVLCWYSVYDSVNTELYLLASQSLIHWATTLSITPFDSYAGLFDLVLTQPCLHHMLPKLITATGILQPVQSACYQTQRNTKFPELAPNEAIQLSGI